MVSLIITGLLCIFSIPILIYDLFTGKVLPKSANFQKAKDIVLYFIIITSIVLKTIDVFLKYFDK
jgi:hypothetical protein